ncbi:XRE family transcriptional regulator [Allorhizobium undicola]|uniref:XRE family transcriptional regulator n=1 Tax=Allorhizobium undicola TaxID=78527 RepID=UPI003D331A9E
MDDKLISRIKALIDADGRSPAAISEKIGGKETLRKILNGSSANPRIDTLSKLANELGSSVEFLLGKTDDPTPAVNAQTPSSNKHHNTKHEEPLTGDVPVLGTAAGSLVKGAFQFAGGVVDLVARPPALIGAKDIYALFVEGSSMEPQYFPGDLIFLHPHKPPRPGDIVVLQCRNAEHSPTEATLGILNKITERTVSLGKRNPSSNVEIERSTVTAIHRVLSVNELFGA